MVIKKGILIIACCFTTAVFGVEEENSFINSSDIELQEFTVGNQQTSEPRELTAVEKQKIKNNLYHNSLYKNICVYCIATACFSLNYLLLPKDTYTNYVQHVDIGMGLSTIIALFLNITALVLSKCTS